VLPAEGAAIVGGEDGVAGAGEESSNGNNGWSNMLPEILGEIVRRVDAAEEQWPNRQNVVACACVCKRWRDITREVVRVPSHTGKITFPACLKQVRGFPLQKIGSFLCLSFWVGSIFFKKI